MHQTLLRKDAVNRVICFFCLLQIHFMSPHQRGGGHVVFGADSVGIGMIIFCVHVVWGHLGFFSGNNTTSSILSTFSKK